VAKILLEKGADPNVVDWKGLNGLCYALKKDNYELAYALLKQSQFKVDLNKYVEVHSYLTIEIQESIFDLSREDSKLEDD
jgi:ankyrin repeat protein